MTAVGAGDAIVGVPEGSRPGPGTTAVMGSISKTKSQHQLFCARAQGHQEE
jgi:hypothetical protein